MISCDSYLFEDDGKIPNNPHLPLVVYLQALTESQKKPEICKKLLDAHHWSQAWVNGIYSYHHYHSTAHEVLAVLSGSAEVQFGGKQGKIVSIKSGDVVLIPAGVGHCLKSSTPGFQIVGAYAGGRSWDLCTGKTDERPKELQNINAVPLPKSDPVTGQNKPLYSYWN